MGKRNAAEIVLMMLLALSIVFIIPNAHALPQSSKVALVPGPYGEALNGGSLPTDPPGGWPNGDTFTFVNLDPNSIATNATDPIVAGQFDTVVFVQLSTNWWTSYPTFASRITSFVSNGGKLIIYDSEITTQNYSTFIYPFNCSAPGAYGSSSGLLWIVENNALGSNSTAIPPQPSYAYVNTTVIGSQTEIGDANVMVTYDSHWKTHIVATNLLGVTGPVHTYAEYGKGLIIWNGQDMDPYDYYFTGIDNANGANAMGMMWYLELKQGFNPTNPPLPGSVSTAGLSLVPGNATNLIGTTHTVTARVTNQTGHGIPSVEVNFSITAGPNTGTKGTGTTNATGEATFSWSSAVPGTDTVTATAKPYTVLLTATATKVWTSPVPEFQLYLILPLFMMATLLAAFVLKRKRNVKT